MTCAEHLRIARLLAEARYLARQALMSLAAAAAVRTY